MFTNYIKNTKNFNQIDLEHEKGLKIYYDKRAIYITFTIHTTLFLAFAALFLISFQDKFYNFFILLFFVFYIHKILQLIGMMNLKNPIFILYQESIYYLFSNKWYEIQNHSFIDRITSRFDYFETFCMIDNKGYTVLQEKKWYFKNIDQMKGMIRYIKITHSKKKI